jgi:hypothetical protein
MLTEHLSEHTEVKSIKVVRDSKGGVCAFVQCEVSFDMILRDFPLFFLLHPSVLGCCISDASDPGYPFVRTETVSWSFSAL